MRDDELGRILREERELVYALGGYALEFSGGTLVTNERLPVPRFNFAQDVRVARDRMAAFFERALDHYFQRALRPAIHLPDPPPAFLAEAFAPFGFSPRAEPHRVLARARPYGTVPSTIPGEVRESGAGELDAWVEVWADTREREELRRFLEVNAHHPNPGEVLRPVAMFQRGTLTASALLHGFHGTWGLHGVATQPVRRGQGAATELVRAVAERFVPTGETLAIWTDDTRALPRLGALGFDEVARFRVFELGSQSELQLPPAAPSTGPLWRPGAAR